MPGSSADARIVVAGARLWYDLAMLTQAEIDAHLQRIAKDGYTIVENAIEPDLVDALAADLVRLEKELGIEPANNDFEGSKTWRIYNLLVHGKLWERVPVHENVLPIVEGVLDPGCLVSSLSSIAIGPGEKAQPIHADDQLMPLPKPHVATVCNSMWALTDFTEENGATRIVPGSHRYDRRPRKGEQADCVQATMPRGSVLVYNGAIWHGGGDNRSDARRLGIVSNFCAGFLRQEENQLLAVPRELAATYPRRLQQLIGYGTYKGLIGHVDQRDPGTLLDPDVETDMVWSRMR